MNRRMPRARRSPACCPPAGSRSASSTTRRSTAGGAIPSPPTCRWRPNLAALEQGDGVRAFLRKQGLQWMVDFNAAVEGRDGDQDPARQRHGPQGFGELLVVGVGDRPDDRRPSPRCSPRTATPRGSTSARRDRRPTTPTRWRRRSAPTRPDLDELFATETARGPPARPAGARRARPRCTGWAPPTRPRSRSA